jgi:hypothetical protein
MIYTMGAVYTTIFPSEILLCTLPSLYISYMFSFRNIVVYTALIVYIIYPIYDTQQDSYYEEWKTLHCNNC